MVPTSERLSKEAALPDLKVEPTGDALLPEASVPVVHEVSEAHVKLPAPPPQFHRVEEALSSFDLGDVGLVVSETLRQCPLGEPRTLSGFPQHLNEHSVLGCVLLPFAHP